jgi:hypothetical protein
MENTWRRCSACKSDIAFEAGYYACNVSTCNRKRTALAFCSVDCWEVHLPGANHRESWAVEKKAPSAASAEADSGPRRRVVRPSAAAPKERKPEEILIVASRLKEFVRQTSGYNTSDRVLEPLSEILRRICREAIENARRDGRMTVLDRDIPDV